MLDTRVWYLLRIDLSGACHTTAFITASLPYPDPEQSDAAPIPQT